MKRKSMYFKVAATLLCTTTLFACTNNSSSETSSETKTETVSANTIVNKEVSIAISDAVTYDNDDLYSDWKSENPTYIKLNGTDAEFDVSAAVLFQDNVLTIKTGGIYVISGKLDNGQIVVDAEDKSTVRLVLNGVEINSSDSSAIHVINAEKTTLSLEEGTENVISDGSQYVFEDSSTDEPNAAIFSKDDLTINGTGKLLVNGNYNNGITSKDELKITGGDIQINAADDGLMGRDLIAVSEGNITIDAGGDGIKSTNDEDTSKGIIALEGGTFDIASGNDGIQAIASLLVSDGTYAITSGDGSPETVESNEERMPGQVGNATTTNTVGTESDSAKGLKASVDIAIGGGTFIIDSLDDAVHSNNSVSIAGGDLKLATGDDGIHADSSIVTTDGNIDISKSYEGIESKSITIEDGEIHLTATDDGINIGGGNDGSGMEMQTDSEGSMLQIKGGYVSVNANGDGLDSNGSISMTGGTVIVNGPTASMNGPLDYNGSLDMSGGFLVAVGSSGMVQANSEESSQSGVLMSYSETQKAGTMVHLEDSEGNPLLTFVPEKDYQSVFISSPQLTKDSTYTLYSGGTSSGKGVDGLYTDGDYQDGTKIVDFTISDTVTWLNESGVTTARSSGPGGGGFNNPDGNQNPTDRGNPDDMFSDLDDETREKVQTIMQQQREGTITQEEAQSQLAELGVEVPVRGSRP